MEFSTELTRQLAELFARGVREHLSDHPDITAAELEGELSRPEGRAEAVQKLGARCLEAALNALERPYPEEKVPCSCGGHAEYRFRRKAKVLSVFGWVSSRPLGRASPAYYVCPTCHGGSVRWMGSSGCGPGR